MPDLDLVTASGPLRVFTLLHKARPALINFGEPGAYRHRCMGGSGSARSTPGTMAAWELPALGASECSHCRC